MIELGNVAKYKIVYKIGEDVPIENNSEIVYDRSFWLDGKFFWFGVDMDHVNKCISADSVLSIGIVAIMSRGEAAKEMKEAA